MWLARSDPGRFVFALCRSEQYDQYMAEARRVFWIIAIIVIALACTALEAYETLYLCPQQSHTCIGYP